MLELNGVAKTIRGRSIVKDVHLKLHNGIVGLLGPNGAGKTTFLRMLATVYEPSAGSIRLNGAAWSDKLEHVRRRIGYLPQHIGLFPALTSYEYLDYIALLRGISSSSDRKRRIERVLAEVNLEDRAKSKVRQLSGGMKQRLGIAQAIIHEPELLLVDEPTAGLDPEERLRFRELLRRLGDDRIIVLSTHITEDVAMTCEQLCMMNKGVVDFFPTLSEVTRLASGKVWAYELAADEANVHRQSPDVHIIQSTETQGRLRIRALSPSQPTPQAHPVEPNIEEGYMVWLREH